MINVSCEINGSYNQRTAIEKTSHIYETMQQVIAISKKQGVTTAKAADQLAEERIKQAKNTLKG